MNGLTDVPNDVSSSQERSLDYLVPFSGRLPALERNILKCRALEMILAIFYCEHLKRKMQTLAFVASVGVMRGACRQSGSA